jgi:hypothetical protein
MAITVGGTLGVTWPDATTTAAACTGAAGGKGLVIVYEYA